MDTDAAVRIIDRELRAAATPERAEHERAYLKSDRLHYGVSVPAIRRVVTRFQRAHGDLGRDDLRELVEALWRRGVHELRMAAVELLVDEATRLTVDDLPLLERLVRESRTWALVDPLAVHVVGPLLESHPVADATLERWARDDDRWLRRSVLLAHLLPMRRGEVDVFARFAHYADAMLEEREPFIRKAIGWVLRERAKRRPDEVFAWLLERRTRASGLTLREASKPLPEPMRARLLEGTGRAAARSP